MKRAVITGGAGFIGSNLCDALLGMSVELLVIDDLSTGNKNNLREAKENFKNKISLIEANITSTRASEVIISFKPDVIFHLAAQMNVRKSVDDPAFDADSNVTGTVNMLEAARKAGTKRFIFSSTGGAIYGEQEYFPADENHSIQPKSPYGVSKRSAELYLEYFGRAAGMSTTSMRFANVYGPRQNPNGEAGVVAIFINRLLAGEELKVNGNGSQTRDYVYVDEVVDACIRAAKADFVVGYKVYNVGRAIESSVNDIVSQLQLIAKDNGFQNVRVANGPALQGEQQRSVISAKALSSELGWVSAIDLKTGLMKTFESFRTSEQK